MCEIKGHNGIIMALGEICLELSSTVISIQRYPAGYPWGVSHMKEMKESAMLVWEYKISTPGGFSAGKANIFAHANLSLRELTSLKKCMQRKPNTSIA